MTWMASSVRKFSFPSVLVHPLSLGWGYQHWCWLQQWLTEAACHCNISAATSAKAPSATVLMYTWQCRRPSVSALIFGHLLLITIKFKSTGVYNPMPQLTDVSFIDKKKEKYIIIWSKWGRAGQFEREFRSSKAFLSKIVTVPNPYLKIFLHLYLLTLLFNICIRATKARSHSRLNNSAWLWRSSRSNSRENCRGNIIKGKISLKSIAFILMHSYNHLPLPSINWL